MSDTVSGSSLRRLAIPVYLPTLLLATAQEAVTPFIVLAARDIGASVAAAAVIFAVRGIAGTLCNLPAGWLIARIGERFAMILAPLLLTASAVGCVVAAETWTFGMSVFGLGAGWSIWKLARLSLLTAVVPQQLRGRALATLGGVTRFGHFAGPVLAVGAISLMDLDGVFWLHVILCVIAVGGLLWLRRIDDPTTAQQIDEPRYLPLIRANRASLSTTGVGVLFLGALRQSRHVAIPLWGTHIGLDASAVGLIFVISAAVEMLLFYPAGAVMDRWGRKHTAVRCGVALAGTFLLLPLAQTFEALLAVALLSAVGNGLASGIVMVLGSDVAPIEGRARFLALWNVMSDLGATVGPLAFSVAGAIASLGGASVFLGAFGLGGTLFIFLRVPETGRPTHPPRGRA
jgi:MFS family permease